MDIGFIGVGQMGFHMARRLLEAGHRVLVCDSRREAVDRITALGASVRGSSAHRQLSSYGGWYSVFRFFEWIHMAETQFQRGLDAAFRVR